jgi:hypothetical protein
MTDPTDPTPVTWDDIRAGLAAVPEVLASPSAAASVIQAASVPDPTTGQPANPKAVAEGLGGAMQGHVVAQVAAKHKSQNLWDNITTAVSHASSSVWDSVPAAIQHPVEDVAGAVDSGVSTAVNAVDKAIPSALSTPLQAISQSSMHVVAHVAQWANWPLQQVQHTYRYYHDVVVHHGVQAGLLELMQNYTSSGLNPLGVIADPITQKATADVLGKQELQGGLVPSYLDSCNTVSGGADAGFDIGLDPLLRAGEISKAVGLGSRAIATVPDLERVATAAKGAKGALNPVYAPVHRALNDIARDNSVASLSEKYPKLAMLEPTRTRAGTELLPRGVGSDYVAPKTLIEDLAKADTYDKVVDAFRSRLAAGQTIGTTTTPTLSLSRIPFRKLNEMSKSWELPKTSAADDLVGEQIAAKGDPNLLAKAKASAARKVSSFVADTPFAREDGQIIGEGGRLDPLHPKMPYIIYQIMKFSETDAAAKEAAQLYSDAPTIAAKAEIHKKVMLTLWHAAGAPYDPDLDRRFLSSLDDATSRAGTNADTEYAMDKAGKSRSSVEANAEGEKIAAPVYTSQGGGLYIPKFMEYKSMARQLRGGMAAFGGKIDDGLYEGITRTFFKRNVLLSGGYAFRNSFSEDLTRVLGRDGLGIIHAGISSVAAQMKYKLMGEAERNALLEQLTHTADEATYKKYMDDPSFLKLAIQQQLRHNGHITSADVAAGHMNASQYGSDQSSNFGGNFARIAMPGNRPMVFSKDRYTRYTSADGIENLSNAVSGHLALMARDPGLRYQARAYRQTIRDLSANREREIIHHPAITDGTVITPRGEIVREGDVAPRTHNLSDDEIRERALEAATKAGHDWLTKTPAGKWAQSYIIRGKYAATFGDDPLWSWAGERAAGLEGQITNANGETIHELLDGLADSAPGHNPFTAPVNGKFPQFPTHPNLHPANVKKLGLDNLPIKGTPGLILQPASTETHLIGRVAEAGFSKVLSPIIQVLARSPIYLHHLREELEAAQRLPISYEDAYHQAEVRAADRMVSEIHNPLDRSQFAQLSRNLLPFYFARQQSFRRMGNALREDPLGWRKLQLAYHGMKDTGFISTDPTTGQDTFNYPFSQEIGRYVPQFLNHVLGKNVAVGIPSGFRGDITGLMPGGDVPGSQHATLGWSPFVTYGAQSLGDMFPELKQPAAHLTGQDPATPLWGFLAPNASVRNAINAYAGDHTRAFNNAILDAVQYQYAHGNPPPDNAAQDSPAMQKWLDGIRAQARTMFTLRAVLGIGAPVTPILEQGDTTLTPEFQALISKEGLGKATQDFLTKHPHATSYTIFKSGASGGVDIPETQVAWDWYKKNKGFVLKNGAVGSYFAPQTDAPDPNALAIWKQEMAAGLRHQKSPEEFANQVAVQQGWNDYEAEHDQFLAAIANITDPTQLKEAHRQWTAYLANNFARSRPAWYADYNAIDARDSKKQQYAKDIQDLLDSGNIPDSPMTPLIKSLARDYANYQAALPNAVSLGTTKQDLHTQWNAYLAQLVVQDPRLHTIVANVYKGQ